MSAAGTAHQQKEQPCRLQEQQVISYSTNYRKTLSNAGTARRLPGTARQLPGQARQLPGTARHCQEQRVCYQEQHVSYHEQHVSCQEQRVCYQEQHVSYNTVATETSVNHWNNMPASGTAR